MAKAIIATNSIIDSILYSDSYSSGQLPETVGAMGELGVAVLEDATQFYQHKREDNDTIVNSIRHLNNLHLANKSSDFDTFNNVNVNTTTCCTQSGEPFLSCTGQLDYYIKYSGSDYTVNTPFMLSGIFEPADNIEIFKGIKTVFNIDAVVTGVGPDGSGIVEHPFKAINFQRIPCETGLLDPSLSGVYGPTANGTISLIVPTGSPITQLKYTCQSGEDSLNYISPSGHVYGTGIKIDVKKERGKILTLDPTHVSLVPVKPEYVIKSGQHDHIPSKFWDFNEDIPCKYGGIKRIKALANRDINCVDYDNFLYINKGPFGIQQIRPTAPDAVSQIYFRDITRYNMPGYTNPNEFVTSSTLDTEGKTKFTLEIGQNATPDLRVYNSRGDVDYGYASTRWPAERVDLYFSSGYYSYSGIHCDHNRFVNTVDDYGFKLCYNSGVLDSFRNISLVDIRTNAYCVAQSTTANFQATVTSTYSKTLEAVPGVYLDENFNVTSLFGTSVKERARAGLKTYQLYYAIVLVENREWDANAGHAYLRTKLETNATRGQMLIASVDEIGRNDYEIGPINWYMGAYTDDTGGSFVARGGITLRGLNPEPFPRCPGEAGGAEYLDCYTRLAQLYSSCNGDGSEGFFPNDMMTFLGYDLNLPAGTVLSDFISVGDLISGPYIPPGTYVKAVFNGSDCDPFTYPYGHFGGGGDPSLYSDNPCYDDTGFGVAGEGGCGPYIQMSTDLTFSNYPIEAQFRGVRYSSYKFTNPSSIGSTEVNLNYLVRSNKAVLYNHAVKIVEPPSIFIATVFTSFEYFDVWRSITIPGTAGTTIHPKYKVPVINPTQSYGYSNYTLSNWDACYRPVSLSAYESKVSQAGAGVANSTYLNYYSYSRRDCQGLYPYYDITSINGGLCPDQLDPFCVICSSYTGGPSAYNPLNATPCLAEDILDYEGNSFYNLPIETPAGGGDTASTRLIRADVLVWGYVVIVELEFNGSVTVVGSPTLQVTLQPGSDTVTATLNSGESTSTLIRFAYDGGADLYDSGDFVVDSSNNIVLTGGTINDSSGPLTLNTGSSSGGAGAVYGPTYVAGSGAATWQDGGGTGHAGNSVFPSGAVQDPRRRFPERDLGGGATAADGEGIIMSENYYGYIDPVSDIINNHNRTHRPNTVGGYDLPDTKGSTYQMIHSKSTEIGGPLNSSQYRTEPFRVYTPDGFAAFLVGIIGNVGYIEHKYYHPPIGIPNGEDTSADGWNGSSLPDCWEEDANRAPVGDEVEKIKICRGEEVPLFMGSFHATTILNNLHINVSQNHVPVSGTYSSYPDSWTRKKVINPVNYTGIAGVLVPPTGFTYFYNDVIMQHNLIGSDYDSTLARTDMGLLSNALSSTESNTKYNVENRIKHTSTNVQKRDTGAITDWYCYELPQKLFSDNCFDTFFGPLTYDRYLLGNPYSDYLSMWSNRCCRERGCDCPDGIFDKFGLSDGTAKVSYSIQPTNWAGSLSEKVRELITKWGHSVPAGGYGWKQECVKCLGIDPRVFYYSEAEKAELGITSDYGYFYSCQSHTGLLGEDGISCGEPYPGNENIPCNGGDMVPGFAVQGYGGSAPGGINSIGEPTQPDGSPHPTNCCELPPDTPCVVGWDNVTVSTAENFSECFGCQAQRYVDSAGNQVGDVTYVNFANPETACADGSFYINYVEIYYDKQTDGYGSNLYARSVSQIGYIAPKYPIGLARGSSYDPFANLQTFTASDCATFASGTPISESDWNLQNSNGPDGCILQPGGCVDNTDYGPWESISCTAENGSFTTALSNQYFSISLNLAGDCEASFILSDANCLMGDKNIYG